MISDDHLTAWLVAIGWNLDHEDEVTFFIPTTVRLELAERGWLRAHDEVDWQGRHEAALTDKGRVVYDLNAAEYGINTIPDLSETTE